MKFVKIFALFFILSPFSNLSAFQKTITNDKPLIEPNSLNLLEHQFSIPNDGGDEYLIYKATHAATDNDKNIYVIDYQNDDSHIIKFDKNGKYINNFAPKGQGPRELDRPSKIFSFNNNLYIYQSFNDIKIMDTNGEYLGKIKIARGNLRFIRFNLKSYASANRIYTDREFKNIKNEIYFNSYTNAKNNTIYTFNSIRKSGNRFYSQYTYSMNSKNEIFFAKDGENYNIIKINSLGKELIIFGRNYSRVKYTQNSINKYNERFAEGIKNNRIKSINGYPPIIRRTFIDDNDLLWVTVGESPMDTNGDLIFNETIDIFNSKGKFLYTFNTDIFKTTVIFSKGNIYTFDPPDEENGEQSINVYKINYKGLIKWEF